MVREIDKASINTLPQPNAVREFRRLVWRLSRGPGGREYVVQGENGEQQVIHPVASKRHQFRLPGLTTNTIRDRNPSTTDNHSSMQFFPYDEVFVLAARHRLHYVASDSGIAERPQDAFAPPVTPRHPHLLRDKLRGRGAFQATDEEIREHIALLRQATIWNTIVNEPKNPNQIGKTRGEILQERIHSLVTKVKVVRRL